VVPLAIAAMLLAAGLAGGLSDAAGFALLFLATAFLIVKGGPMVGQHLQLLSAFFPGYRVTWLGSLIGFVYAFVLGYALGRLIGAIYNRLAFGRVQSV